MNTIELSIDNDIFDRISNFLESLPVEKIKIRMIDTHIPIINDTEQYEIESLLKNESCHQASRSKVVAL